MSTPTKKKDKRKECPICFVYLTTPVFQCFHGHLICEECLNKVEQCPICRERYPQQKIRARGFEELMQEIFVEEGSNLSDDNDTCPDIMVVMDTHHTNQQNNEMTGIEVYPVGKWIELSQSCLLASIQNCSIKISDHYLRFMGQLFYIKTEIGRDGQSMSWSVTLDENSGSGSSSVGLSGLKTVIKLLSPTPNDTTLHTKWSGPILPDGQSMTSNCLSVPFDLLKIYCHRGGRGSSGNQYFREGQHGSWKLRLKIVDKSKGQSSSSSLNDNDDCLYLQSTVKSLLHHQQQQQQQLFSSSNSFGARERMPIWCGVLEYHEKHYDGQKVAKSVSCQVSSSVVNGRTELTGHGWPARLVMQFVPKVIAASLGGGGYYGNAKTVYFSIPLSPSNFTRLMDTGYVGVVHFTGHNNSISVPANSYCPIQVLILYHDKAGPDYRGVIPNDQSGFVEKMRQVIRQQKSQPPSHQSQSHPTLLQRIVGDDNEPGPSTAAAVVSSVSSSPYVSSMAHVGQVYGPPSSYVSMGNFQNLGVPTSAHDHRGYSSGAAAPPYLQMYAGTSSSSSSLSSASSSSLLTQPSTSSSSISSSSSSSLAYIPSYPSHPPPPYVPRSLQPNLSTRMKPARTAVGYTDSWRDQGVRQAMVNKLQEAIVESRSTTSKNPVEMEVQLFNKARSRDEYLSFVARLIIHIKDTARKQEAAARMNVPNHQLMPITHPIPIAHHQTPTTHHHESQLSNQWPLPQEW